jgi:hypothetical protein
MTRCGFQEEKCFFDVLLTNKSPCLPWGKSYLLVRDYTGIKGRRKKLSGVAVLQPIHEDRVIKISGYSGENDSGSLDGIRDRSG